MSGAKDRETGGEIREPVALPVELTSALLLLELGVPLRGEVVQLGIHRMHVLQWGRRGHNNEINQSASPLFYFLLLLLFFSSFFSSFLSSKHQNNLIEHLELGRVAAVDAAALLENVAVLNGAVRHRTLDARHVAGAKGKRKKGKKKGKKKKRRERASEKKR